MNREKLAKILFFSSIVLTFSSILDFTLWFLIKFRVPSWTIATLSLSYAITLIAFERVISGE